MVLPQSGGQPAQRVACGKPRERKRLQSRDGLGGEGCGGGGEAEQRNSDGTGWKPAPSLDRVTTELRWRSSDARQTLRTFDA